MLRRFASHRYNRTTVWAVLCAAILVGIGAARFGEAISPIWCLALVAPTLLTLRSRTFRTLLLVAVFGLALGGWRGSVYMTKLAQNARYFDHKVTVTAVAKQDAAYNKYKQLAFDASDLVVQGTGEHLHGKFSISGMGENAVFAGDRVQATGKLKSSLGSYQGRMSFAQLHVQAHHNTVVNELRRRFTSGMQSALPEPLASFGMGLLIGQRNNLPPDVSQTLLMVGLTHIIAVSGYNLTILLRSSERMSGKRSKRLTMMFSLALIGLFLLFAGTSASIVRASIVSMLSIAAGYYGRQFKPLLLLLLAAVITGFASPFYIWADSGWYLSFLAFYGVMIIAPMIAKRFMGRWQESFVPMIALESLCAEMMTLPFVLHAFGQMSLISLPGNVLVAALVPLAMLFGLIAGLAGMLIPAIAGWFAWPAQILLTYMLDMTRLLSRVPHTFIQNRSFSWQLMIMSYAVVVMFTLLLHFKMRARNGKITDEKEKDVRFERTLQMVND